MGVFGCCAKACGLAVLLLALVIGYLSTQLHPMGTVFSTIFTLQGFGKPPTEAVPEDLAPSPRPEGEIFFDLPGGQRMPANGIGMCCRPTAYDAESAYRTVLWYLLKGGRHIDTASVYLNHASVGRAIKEAVRRGVPRSEIFLVTKVWFDHFGYESTLARGKEMVKELGVDYIDLVLIHMPFKPSPQILAKYFFAKYVSGGAVSAKLTQEPIQKQYRADTWRALSELRDQGLIRNAGVSNFNIEQMKEIQALKLAPIAANQVQYHPWLPDWMKDVVKYCRESKVAVVGYFSLGGHDNKDKAFGIDVLNEIAKTHGRRPAQILLRWSLQKNVTVIPGTGSHKHMADNLGTYGFSLSKEDMLRLDGMAAMDISKDFLWIDF